MSDKQQCCGQEIHVSKWGNESVGHYMRFACLKCGLSASMAESTAPEVVTKRLSTLRALRDNYNALLAGA